ncbi:MULTISPECIES: glutaredoxin family protein [Carboxydothermus]|uniref:Glutaredoxin n=2 Tax=Carboxydothermus TaxID=129957 RepID=Q3AEK9_CARHZ|nr:MULTISPECIES: glutaredoxin family protein [Carboxydothermus]ABB14797.1 glutaredoxin [Carboxydothermus hydrogenoformans Z-2901]NYE56447.1 glutaredoxin [Carboxydothermus ferrireducens DSM 11255]
MAKIELFSTPTCPYCRLVRNFLQEKGLNFTDYDITKDLDAFERMFKTTGYTTVPTLIINDKEVIIGLDEERILKAVNES